MRRFLSVLVLILCLLPAGCGGETAAPDSTPEPKSSETAAAALTPEEALDILSQTLLERRPRLLSYDPETGFAVDGYHFIWWTEEPPAEPEIDGQVAYEFQLLYGPDADGDLPPGQDAHGHPEQIRPVFFPRGRHGPLVPPPEERDDLLIFQNNSPLHFSN